MEAAPSHPDASRRAVHRWIGLLLVAGVAGLWIFAFLFLQTACGDDCGDQGGRGVLLVATLASPAAVVGARLIVSSTRAGLEAGQPPGSAWRLVIRAIMLTLACGVGAATLAVLFFFITAAVDVVAPDWYAQDDQLAPLVYVLLAVASLAVAWLGRTALPPLQRLLRDWH
jgi:hypothetical protein